MKYNITNEEFINVVNNNNIMLTASKILKIPFMTFRARAIKLGVYKPNQSRKGIKRSVGEYKNRRIPISDILNGKYPHYQTSKLKKRLIKEKLKENKCEECGITKWNNKQISIQLHHIDGNSRNHNLKNLCLLCPNCHSQTNNHSGKKG